MPFEINLIFYLGFKLMMFPYPLAYNRVFFFHAYTSLVYEVHASKKHAIINKRLRH